MSRQPVIARLATLIIAATIVSIVPVAARSEKHGPKQARRLVQRGEIVPMKQIVEKAERLKAGKLLEAGLHRTKKRRYVYTVEILDTRNNVWEFKFNGKTGELMTMKEEKEDEEDD
jgi:uncharacterized membrane protein YkoI